jgi:hypothetical protein
MKSKELSSDVVSYLKKSGFSDRRISRMNVDTCLYHDLGFDGDTAEEMIEFLAQEYGVDVSNFDFDRHFPREFPGDTHFASVIGSFIPFWRFFQNRKKQFSPVTLLMIDQAIKSKHWQS